MNEKLKFSWGHIIAFLAIIFVSYVTFVGLTYLTDGDYKQSFLLTIVIVILLILFFIGGQIMKGTERKFSKRVIFERIFILGSPLVFILTMLPYTHFWTVHSQNDVIVGAFTNAIEKSNSLFDDYDNYATKRIDNYSSMLERVIGNKRNRSDEFKACGFKDGQEIAQKTAMIKTLRLQLISENYDSLKHVARAWIASASKGASTWNVFLLGNIAEIDSAIVGWQKQLQNFSSKKMSNEDFQSYNIVSEFVDASNSVNEARGKLSQLTSIYTRFKFPNAIAIITAIFLYLMLLLPYIIQDRHTKNVYRLFGMEEGYSKPFSRGTSDYSNKNISMDSEVEHEYSSSNFKPQHVIDENVEDDDEYGSFTL